MASTCDNRAPEKVRNMIILDIQFFSFVEIEKSIFSGALDPLKTFSDDKLEDPRHGLSIPGN